MKSISPKCSRKFKTCGKLFAGRAMKRLFRDCSYRGKNRILLRKSKLQLRELTKPRKNSNNKRVESKKKEVFISKRFN